jgi:HSP20 family protein
MTSRTNPFSELERLFDQWNRQLEESADWWDAESVRPMLRSDEFALDVLEEPDHLTVTVDVPGYDRDELDVRVADRTLWIEAEHREEEAERDENYLRRERRRKSDRRQLKLPTAVDADAVTANLKNGVLTITIPKAEPEADAHEIEIESE